MWLDQGGNDLSHIGREQRISGSRRVDGCEHPHCVTTFIAGLARSVCETCGDVSIRYLGEGAHWPEASSTSTPEDGPGRPQTKPTPLCKRCHEEAYFITPWGLACPDHAWDAASRQDPLAGEFWIPLLIDRTDITG